MRVKVVTDSGSDITMEEAQRLGITVIPVYLRFGDKVYRDGVDMDRDELYRRLVTSPVHPSTAAPSPGDFANVYEEVARESSEIISIHITRKHSAVCDAATVAKELVEKKIKGCRIEVIDSQGVTMWQGLVAIAAAKAAEAGYSLEQVRDKAHETIEQLHVLALLDTVTYAIKGGRLSKALSSIGSVLNAKLLITLRHGQIRPVGLVRTRSRGIDRLRKFIRSASGFEELALVHSTSPDDAQALAEYARSLSPGVTPRIASLGAALGVHGGPGALVAVVRKPS